jgi:hypothetical protein
MNLKTGCRSKNTIETLTFQPLGNKNVEANFDGGKITSDGGALLLREVDAAHGLLQEFSKCFDDGRDPRYIEHRLQELLSQRVYGICLGYEDLNDHDRLRNDPLLASVCGKEDPEGDRRKQRRDWGKALAGKSTLQRLETAGEEESVSGRYHKIFYDAKAIERYFVEVFLKTYGEAPRQITIDVDATDDPLHGEQEGRFFHGYYDCYCYLPLYIFCGGHLLSAKLRVSNIDPSEGVVEELERIVERIREQWPGVKVLIRGDSGFCREGLMSWCEGHGVDYVFGMARNVRLIRRLEKTLGKVRRKYLISGEAQRVYRNFMYRTLNSWSRKRRVVGKAEYLPKGENPRFIVTSVSKEEKQAKELYEKIYCARGDMENRIKEQQLYLFADRTSSSTMRANQLRLWLSSVAYVIMNELRSRALRGTEFARAQCGSIRLKLLKIGAQVRVSVRRVRVSFASGYPYQDSFYRILRNIREAYPQLC